MEQNQQIKNLEPSKNKPLGFGKTMLASGLGMVIGFAIINLLGFFFMIGILAAIATSGNQTADIKSNTFLKIDLTKPINERTPSELQQIFSEDGETGLIDMLLAIEMAKNDDHINGIYLYMGNTTAQSWGQSEELRMALDDFTRNSCKPVIAYADLFNLPGYYIASAATKIIMHPAGELGWRGIAAQPMFYGDLFKKFDVHMDLIRPRSNAYKSAGESYTMNHMSEANKEQIRAYITSIWNHVLEQVSVTRNIAVEDLNRYADNLTCIMPQKSVAVGMIDTLAFEYDAKQLMEKKYSMDQLVSISDYAKTIKKLDNKNHIAVVYAQGDVVTGKNKGFQTAVYGDDVADALDQAASDDEVNAIILRVNSPGGAVIASEIMTAAVMRAKAKKPVIVSMSDLAASAGYEISCNATRIVALPTTITGSIGVFAAIPEVGDLLKRHLGITTDTVMTNRNSGGVNGMRPMSPLTREMMQNSIEDFYQTFIGRVAKGRGMKIEEVDQIARGRVWTGSDAIKIGLVDTLGGFPTAVKIACQEAGITDDDFQLVNYPKDKDAFSELMELTSSKEARVQLFNKHFGKSVPIDEIYNELVYWSRMDTYQARIPFILNIQ